MPYMVAWLIAIAAGLGLGGVMIVLTRFISIVFIRTLVVLLIPVLLLVPAPVPGYEENYAPAFLVLLVEGLFQAEGQIGQALQALVLSGVAVSGLVLLWFGVAKLTRRAA